LIGTIVLPSALLGVAHFTNQSLSILPAQNTYVQLFLNQTGFIVVGYQSGARLNFYFANASGFNILKGYMNSTITLSQWATRLQGNGVLESIPNSTVGIYPYSQFAQPNSVPSGAYSMKNVTLLPAGNYYAIFQNLGSSTARVNVTTDVSTNISSKGAYIFGIGIVIFIIFLAGIILIVYGIIKKPKAAAQMPGDEKKIDELYKGVDGKHKGKARK
ncbi:MAG: hypothetical protein KGH71_06205, partial [Candidatus Micrarchaeota archaeon]|nr:hypothetical protein [Candidatus Micrarchaeota archaeon]